MSEPLKDKVLAKFQEIKTTIDELENQLSLGGNEAKEEFERQKANLKTFADDLKTRIMESDLVKSEKGQELKAKLEGLQVQLALGKAESLDALEDQREKLEDAVTDIAKVLESGAKTFSEKLDDVLDNFEIKAEKFKTTFEIARLQFALGKAELEKEVEKNKAEITVKLRELKGKLEENREVALDKVEGFKTEMFEAFSHFKKAVDKLK